MGLPEVVTKQVIPAAGSVLGRGENRGGGDRTLAVLRFNTRKQTPLEMLCSLLLGQLVGYQKIKDEHHLSLLWAEYRSLRSTGISPLTVLLSTGILRR